MRNKGLIVVFALGLAGLAAGDRGSEGREVPIPTESARDLMLQGKHHEAMRMLPGLMARWEAYTRATGHTQEGTAGFEHHTTLEGIANSGDAAWGAILDDPEIPYAYKVELVFEILEARLGKGAVYVADEHHLVVPRRRPIDLDTERMRLVPREEPKAD